MAIIKTTDKDKLDFDAAISELSEYFSSLGARKGRTLTYNVLTYGCQLNESDSEKLTGMLTSMGLKESSCVELDAAEVIRSARVERASRVASLATVKKPSCGKAARIADRILTGKYTSALSMGVILFVIFWITYKSKSKFIY